jgi:hypothetical protein
MMVFIYSGAFVGTKLCRGGMSSEVRKQVMSRHVAYSIAFIVTMLYPFTCTLFIFKGFRENALQR